MHNLQLLQRRIGPIPLHPCNDRIFLVAEVEAPDSLGHAGLVTGSELVHDLSLVPRLSSIEHCEQDILRHGIGTVHELAGALDASPKQVDLQRGHPDVRGGHRFPTAF